MMEAVRARGADVSLRFPIPNSEGIAVFGRLVLLFVLLPFVEMVLLLVLADLSGWRTALVFIVVTGIAGAWLLRVQGVRTWRTIQNELAGGRMPAEALWDAAMLLVAGALLLTPGVLTDLTGVLLLFPPCRRLVRVWLLRRIRVHTSAHTTGTPGDTKGESEIIDSYVVKRHS
jgi:UPF0716 protein FxsA